MISLPGATPNMLEIVNTVAQNLLADDPPPTEAVAPNAGVAQKARRRDAQSARLTSQTEHVTTAGGTTRVMFTRKFTRMPGVIGTMIEAQDNGPAEFKVLKFVNAAGTDWNKNADQSVEDNQIAGCDVYWYRLGARPNLGNYTPLTLASFLFSTINGLLSPIYAALAGQANWSAIAAGIPFTCTAVASSQPAP